MMVAASDPGQNGAMITADAPHLPALPPLSAQVDRLIEKQAHAPAGLDEDTLRAAAEQWGSDRTDALVALTPEAVPASALTELLSLDGEQTSALLDMVDVDEAEPAGIDLPDSPVYLVHDPHHGGDLSNRTPAEALPTIATRDRSPLLLTEGLHWVLQQPAVLERGHGFMTAGSLLRRPGGFYNSRTPALWGADGRDNHGRPRPSTLSWSWWGSSDRGLGIASAARRTPAPAI